MSEVYNLAHSTRVEHEFARDLEGVRAYGQLREVGWVGWKGLPQDMVNEGEACRHDHGGCAEDVQGVTAAKDFPLGWFEITYF